MRDGLKRMSGPSARALCHWIPGPGPVEKLLERGQKGVPWFSVSSRPWVLFGHCIHSRAVGKGVDRSRHGIKPGSVFEQGDGNAATRWMKGLACIGRLTNALHRRRLASVKGAKLLAQVPQWPESSLQPPTF